MKFGRYCNCTFQAFEHATLLEHHIKFYGKYTIPLLLVLALRVDESLIEQEGEPQAGLAQYCHYNTTLRIKSRIVKDAENGCKGAQEVARRMRSRERLVTQALQDKQRVTIDEPLIP